MQNWSFKINIKKKMKIKTLIGAILWFSAIVASLIAIFRITANIEIAVGFITISFGILAIIWTSIAIRSLSPGSSLRGYTKTFLFCLIFIILFSIWHALGKMLLWEGLIVFPEYVFIAIAYLIFAAAAYRIWRIGKEFGFKEQATRIKRVMVEKKKQKKKKK